MELRQAFAKVIKEIRLEQGLSQEKLAEKAGLSMRSIYLIECEKLQPTISTIESLAEALGIKVSDLILRAEKYSQPVKI